MERKFVYYLTYFCSAQCFFCGARQEYLRHGRRLNPSWEDVRRTLAERRRAGCGFVVFTGGEPTESPFFPAAVRLARRLGFRVGVNTNLLKFAEPAFCRDTLPYVDELNGAVHGASAETHDRVVNTPGAFSRIERAFDNIERAETGRDFRLMSNTVMNVFNLPRLGEALDFLMARRMIRRMVFSMAALPPQALPGDLSIVPRLADVAEAISRLAAKRQPQSASLCFEGVPLCVLGDRRFLSADLYFESHSAGIRESDDSAIRSRIVNVGEPRERFHTSKCASCTYADLCGGINRFYFDHWGDAELGPILPDAVAS